MIEDVMREAADRLDALEGAVPASTLPDTLGRKKLREATANAIRQEAAGLIAGHMSHGVSIELAEAALKAGDELEAQTQDHGPQDASSAAASREALADLAAACPEPPWDSMDRDRGTGAIGPGEARQRAEDWAEGRLSHNNALLGVERNPEDRAATLALIAFADAQEVVKWSALAVALTTIGQSTEGGT